MTLLSQMSLLEQMHFHIEHKSTETPKAFARRLKVSERSLYRLLAELNGRGVCIVYNRSRGYYEYQGEYRIPDLFKVR